MDSPSHLLTVFTIFSFFLFLCFPTQTNASSKLVNNICNETLDCVKCHKALALDPRTKSAKDLNLLAKISLQLAIANAKDSFSFINQLLSHTVNNNKNSNASGSEPIKRCVFWYRGVVSSFQSALMELKEDVETANYDIKIAGDDADACEEGLKAKGVVVPSIFARNGQVKLYSSIGLVITNRL